MSYFIRGAQGYQFPGNGYGLKLAYSNDDTLAVSAGEIILPNRSKVTIPAASVTFASLDTGSRAIGDYALFAMASGLVLTRIETSHSGAGLRPSVAAADASDCALLGYFHNGAKADGTVGAARNQAIFPYSITNNALLNMVNPYRAHTELPAGVPLPGMVKIGPLAIGIYQMSREDATASDAGSSAYPTSRYGVVPWAGIDGWATMAVARNVGCRLPTWEEWLGCVEFNPGSATPAVMNGNTGSGASSDDTILAVPAALTSALAGAGAGLLGNGLYKYKVTLVNAQGETLASAANAGTTVADYTSDGKIALSGIATGAAGTTARKIYRTVAGGSTYKLLATIADNTTTTYADNIADASLGANEPTHHTAAAQFGTADPTKAARTLTGTGPRTANVGATAAGRSWYSPAGLADPVGNVWELVAQFFGGLKTSSPGTAVPWGGSGDNAYNFQGQANNPDTGGWTEGLPSLLFVGGSWYDGANAGVRAVNANYSAGYGYSGLGARLSR